MSSSKSLKTDKELMWKKLSTLPPTHSVQTATMFQQAIARGRRRGKTEMLVEYITRFSKTYYDIESN